MDHYFTNNNLKSNLFEFEYKFKDTVFKFCSDNGVFSKKFIDYGSALLIEEYLKANNKNLKMLDVGCGYGPIGIIISKFTYSFFDLVDINKRSVHLAKMNIEKNNVTCNAFVSNVYENVTEKYDVIVTNPPIRAGKNVVLEILKGAKKHLKFAGELWFVIRKNQGALSTMKLLEDDYNIEIIKKDKGYYIFKAKIVD